MDHSVLDKPLPTPATEEKTRIIEPIAYENWLLIFVQYSYVVVLLKIEVCKEKKGISPNWQKKKTVKRINHQETSKIEVD